MKGFPRNLRRYLTVLLIGLLGGVWLARAFLRPKPVNGDWVAMTPIEAALKKPIHRVSLNNVTIEEALAELQRATGVTIAIDEKSFENSGVSTQARLTVNRRGLTLEEALDAVTDASETSALHWSVTERSVVFGTHHLVSNMGFLTTRAYEVADLLGPLAQSPRVLGGPRQPSGSFVCNTTDELKYALLGQFGRLLRHEEASFIMIGSKLVVTSSSRVHQKVKASLLKLRSPYQPSSLSGTFGQRFDPISSEWVSTDPDVALKKLRQTLPTFAADTPSLTPALRLLEKSTGLHFQIDDEAVKQLRRRGHPVKIDRQNQTVIEVLRAVLTSAAGSTIPPETGFVEPPLVLDWWLDGEMVVITTRDRISNHTVDAMYDMRAWLTAMAGPAGVGGNAPGFNQTARQAVTDRLVAALQENVASETGHYDWASGCEGFFFITHTYEGHEHVKRFFERVRLGQQDLVLTDQARKTEP